MFSGLPSYALKATPTIVTRLSNGVRVASETSGCATATVSVWVDAGSRYESKALNGASFLGGKAILLEPSVQAEITKLGGQVAAYTSREQTVYYATVMKEQVGDAMALLSTLVKGSPSASTFEAAKAEILAEFESADIKSGASLLEELHGAAYLDDPLGMPIKGFPQTISTLGVPDVQALKSASHVAPRVVIAAAGGVTQDELVALAEKNFGSLSTTSTGPQAPKAVFCGSDKRIRFDSGNVAHVAIAFETGGWKSEQSVPLMLMQTLLGSWSNTSNIGVNMASKFGQDISSGNLVVNYSSFLAQYKDTGLFGISAVAEETKLDDMMFATTYHLVRICHQVTDAEVERAKINLKANILAQTNSSYSICEDIGRQLLSYGRRISLSEMFMRIDAVTTADIKQVGKDVINDHDHALAAIGPIYELPDYNWIRRRSYWLRY